MASDNVEDLRLDLEYLDGVVKAQLLAVRVLLRSNPSVQQQLSSYLEHASHHGFGVDLSSEQQRAMDATLKQLVEPSGA